MTTRIFRLGQVLAEDRNGGQRLQRGDVAATRHHHVRLAALIVAGPLPDADPFRAMLDGGVHGQPLGGIVLAANHEIDVVQAAQAMIHGRQEAVCVGRKVDAHHLGLLVDDVVDESGILVREAVVVLPPDVGGQQVVQRGDLPPPRQFQAHLQPLGVLGEHRVDDADERLVAVEQPVPPGQQVPLQPTFALVLAEHLHDAAAGREEFIIRHRLGFPLPIGDLEDGFQPIGDRLVGTEDPEVPRILVQLDHVAKERAQHVHIAGLDGGGRGHVHGVVAEVRHAQFAQQLPAVGVGIGTHPSVALRRQFGQFGQEPAALVEEFFRLVASHPAFELREMLGRSRGETRRAAPDVPGTCPRPADHRRISVRSSP